MTDRYVSCDQCDAPCILVNEELGMGLCKACYDRRMGFHVLRVVALSSFASFVAGVLFVLVVARVLS